MSALSAIESPRLGIIGTGNRGVHTFGRLLNARDDCSVVALCDANGARLEAARELLGGTLALYTEPETMMREAKLDAVVITAPDFLHASLTIAALEAGVRHVLVDKPLATTATDCLAVAQAAQLGQGRVVVGFNLRENPVVSRVKELIEEGELGELMLIENREFYDLGRTYMARWNRFYELSGGLWVHKGSHDFDVFNWWNAGGTPLRVAASAGLNALRPDKLPFETRDDVPVGPTCSSCAYAEICPDYSAPVAGTSLQNAATQAVDGYFQDTCIFLSEKDTHDNGIALVEYDNNVRASHAECFVCGFTDRLFTITGDRGTLFASLANPATVEVRPRWGEAKIIDVPPPPDPKGGHGGADSLLVERFISSIRAGDDDGATIRDGTRSVAIGHAAEIASRERRSVDIAEIIDLNSPSLAR